MNTSSGEYTVPHSDHKWGGKLMNKSLSILFLVFHIFVAACGSQEVSIPPAVPVTPPMNTWVTLPAEKQSRVVCYYLYAPKEESHRYHRAICRDEDLDVCWYEKGQNRRGYAVAIPCEKLEAWVGPNLE
jgi:hypothetical protein